MPRNNIQPEEGDILWFWHNDSQKSKYAVNLEPKRIHKNKPTFNGVLLTTQNIEKIYSHDYLLTDGTMKKPTKVICDQPQAIPKSFVSGVTGKINKQDLDEIRKKTADSLGIKYYQNSTS